jgi:hypothetical protein
VRRSSSCRTPESRPAALGLIGTVRWRASLGTPGKADRDTTARANQASELLFIRGDIPIAAERIAWTSGKDSAAVAFSMPRGDGDFSFRAHSTRGASADDRERSIVIGGPPSPAWRWHSRADLDRRRAPITSG